MNLPSSRDDAVEHRLDRHSESTARWSELTPTRFESFIRTLSGLGSNRSTSVACFGLRVSALAWLAAVFTAFAPLLATDAASIALGTRRELFVDDFLIAQRSQVKLRLHRPTPREVVLVCDEPWEGPGSNFVRVFRDGPKLAMYYNGWDLVRRPILTCYAESTDGITWAKPKLGLFEFGGSRENNIIWDGPTNFTPFKDTNPNCRPGEEYKALAAAPGGLYAVKSADGLRWSRL